MYKVYSAGTETFGDVNDNHRMSRLLYFIICSIQYHVMLPLLTGFNTCRAYRSYLLLEEFLKPLLSLSLGWLKITGTHISFSRHLIHYKGEQFNCSLYQKSGPLPVVGRVTPSSAIFASLYLYRSIYRIRLRRIFVAVFPFINLLALLSHLFYLRWICTYNSGCDTERSSRKSYSCKTDDAKSLLPKVSHEETT